MKTTKGKRDQRIVSTSKLLTPQAKEKLDAKKKIEMLNLRFLGAGEGTRLKPRQLIDGLITEGSIVGLVGPSASFKSFIVTAICASVSTGQRCFDRKTRKGMVVLLSGEGASGLELRFYAYAKSQQIDRASLGSIALTDRAMSLSTDRAAQALSDKILAMARKSKQKVALVCFDPLSKIIDGLDENSASDMNAFINRIDRYFRQRLGATVLLVHHTGHGNQSRARGSAAFEAALDSVYVVRRKNKTQRVTIECTKQKDAAEAKPFELEAFEVPVGPKGKSARGLALRLVQPPKSKRERVLGALRSLARVHGKVRVEEWCEKVLSENLVPTRKAFDRHREDLAADGIIEVKGGVAKLK